jgi:Flp pilus assembly protein TadD
VAALLALVTIAAYAPVRHNGFVDLDDPGYITDNPHVAAGITPDGVAWAFTTGHAANWHPLTWLSHMLDVELFGMNAGAHHLVSLAIHVANTILLFWLLARLTSRIAPAAAVAALFGVHPVHVESVAWAAERKDVLSTLFWLLTMWAYAAWVKRPGTGRHALVIALYACGLMAKPMLVSLPLVLLLLHIWPLGSGDPRAVPWRRVLARLAPLFALAAASSVVTLVVQRAGGAVSTLDVVPVATRFANALVATAAYLGKLVWPVDLAVFYPYPRAISPAAVAVAAALVAGLSVVAVRTARRRPYVLVGWLWYLLTLVPVVGLVQVGTQAMADRYTYVPLIGVLIALFWLVAESGPRARLALPAATAVVTLALVGATRAQVRHWESSLTLWQHTVEVTSDNYRARNSLAAALGNAGRPADALVHLTEALRLAPDASEAFHIHHNTGRALADLGRFAEAITHYRDALRLKPDYPEAHNNLGMALAREGQVDEAIAEYRLALEDRPGFPPATANLAAALDQRGFAHAASGRIPEALADFRDAVQTDPRLEPAHYHLGLVLAGTGRFDEAETHLNTALALNPSNAGARQALDRVQARRKGGR